jgi:Ca2+-binding EF-hand superfamily protein
MIEGIGGFNSQSFAQIRESRGDHPKSGQALFNRVDQNDSGGVDKSELQALVDKTGRGGELLEKFDRIDQDGSGELSFREIKASLKEDHSGQRLFNIADQNDSGGVDADELQALVDRTGRGGQVLENFAEVDKDGSGELSFREIASYYKNIDETV